MSLSPAADSPASNPLFKTTSIFLIAISLSIGWGIRGDFGHEAGAWLPGALAAIAVCLLSRRQDWHERVAYCALFGALGWGFGGSISYMFPMSYVDSGQWETTLYGYYTLFFEGGLWAGVGAAGMVLPLVMDRDRLTRFFRPFLVVLAAMIINHWLTPLLESFLNIELAEAARDITISRHKGPLYWFDTDWVAAIWALIGVCIFDLCSRRFSKFGMLILLAALGAAGGWALQWGLNESGATPSIVSAVVIPQGDLSYENPETGEKFARENLMLNWPQFFSDYPQHVGWWLGLMLGIGIYFFLYGKWQDDSGLLVYMALGWWLAFLAMPVFGSLFLTEYGGFRMTPPRGDNWAGVAGVLAGACVYSLRNGIGAVAYAGTMNFVLGGIGFSTVKLVRQMLQIPGNPQLHSPEKFPELDEWRNAWAHYQSANWHSMLEQTHGFCHGIATAITMALLWNKMRTVDDNPRVRRWTEPVAVGMTLFFVTYVNVFKNVAEWTKSDRGLVPPMMKAPLFQWIDLSAEVWFNLAWCAISLACVALMFIHVRRPLAVVPTSWLGKGQLIYLILLWTMIIADFERSLKGFSEQRLVTEWVIMINGAIATFLIVALPGPAIIPSIKEPTGYLVRTICILLLGAPIALLIMTGYAAVQYRIYGGTKLSTAHYRFGPEAMWRVSPILKNKKHR